VPDEKFQIQEALLGAVAKRHDIAELPTDKDESFNPRGVRLVYCRLWDGFEFFRLLQRCFCFEVRTIVEIV